MKNCKNKIIGLLVLLLIVQSPLSAQDDGKLGDFEDAVKGQKSDDKDDDDGDGGGFLGFFFDIGLDMLFSDEDEEDTEEGYIPFVDEQQVSFGSYPFDTLGIVSSDYQGKQFLGRISGGYQHIDSRINAFRFNARLQFYRRHGLNLDFGDYREQLIKSTDHLQIIGMSYRNLIVAENNVLIGANIGLTIIKPDNFKDADYGLNLAADLQWFFAEKLSINAKLGFAPILEYLHYDRPPGLWDMEIGMGVHIQSLEFFASYKTLIPTFNSASSLYGPEMGIRIWF